MKAKPRLTLKPLAARAGFRGGLDGLSVETHDLRVTAEGGLELMLHDGNPVTVTPRGAFSSNASANSSLAMASVSPRSSREKKIKIRINWEDLQIGVVIGYGSQATVKKVTHGPTGTVFAMKAIDLNGQSPRISPSSHPRIKRILQSELSRLAATAHPNVVTYHEAFFLDHHVYLLMDFMNAGSLSTLLRLVGWFPMNVLAALMTQVLQGLAHLHDTCHLVHCDLKPSNLLLNHLGIVKIADFGVSSALGSGTSSASTASSLAANEWHPLGATANYRTERPALTPCGVAMVVGSTAYLSPERIRGEACEAAADIWSLGITCAECALGTFPFFPEDVDISVEADENPFENPINMFDLSAAIVEERVTIHWDLLIALISRFGSPNLRRLGTQPLTGSTSPPDTTTPSSGLPTAATTPSTPPPTPQLDISAECKDFVACCLLRRAKDRPSASELLANHPFLQLSSFPNSDPSLEVAEELVEETGVTDGDNYAEEIESVSEISVVPTSSSICSLSEAHVRCPAAMIVRIWLEHILQEPTPSRL